MGVKDKKALNAMTRARTCLVVAQPFFGCLSLQLELVEVEDEKRIPTMGVDGRHLFYNPTFTLGLSEQEVIGVIAHEVMHCAYKHMLRRGHRDHRLYNIAGDFVINLDVIEAGFKLPGTPVTIKSPLGTKGYLYDPQYKGLSTEEVYEKLLSSATKIKIGNLSEKGEGDIGGCGVCLDADTGDNQGGKEGEGSGSAVSRDQLEADWDANIRMAANVAKSQNAGNIPGHLKRLVDALDKPRINWREQLRDFISSSMSKDYTWLRPNRRSVACGVLLPGFISDAMQHLVMVMDCSGSIGEDIMKVFASEGAGMLDDGVCDKMTVVYTDTKVQKVDEFLRGDVLKVEPSGGGGTDFKEVMEWIPENCPDANCVVFLTDMYTGNYGQDPDIPVLWGSTTTGSALAQVMQPTFGRVIEVNMND